MGHKSVDGAFKIYKTLADFVSSPEVFKKTKSDDTTARQQERMTLLKCKKRDEKKLRDCMTELPSVGGMDMCDSALLGTEKFKKHAGLKKVLENMLHVS